MGRFFAEVKRITNLESVLILQFHGEFQIAAFQTLGDPLVDAAIQFRTEMILPVTRFTFLNRT